MLGLGLFVSVEAGLFGHGELRRGPASAGGSGFQTGLTRYPDDRSISPPLKGTTLDGASFDLADLRGDVVVINAWGSWCNPCRAEAPDLTRVARETAALQVRFVGIDTRDNAASARAFVRTFKVPYPSVVDTDGRVLLAFSKVLPMSAVPSTLVLDRDGRIAARVIGRTDYPTLRGLVDDVLTERSTETEAGDGSR
jgi:thiol-disulfide isomerase/thioredoxin